MVKTLSGQGLRTNERTKIVDPSMIARLEIA